MKKSLFLLAFLGAIPFLSPAQGFKNIIKRDSAGKHSVSILNKSAGRPTLSKEEIISGLKEALSVGTSHASQQLSTADGFFKDAVVKILMPEEAVKAEKKLRGLGMGKMVDDAILSMNRAAEEASKNAAPIFINAIKQMSIQDAFGILKGNDFAATTYLKDKTTTALTEAFRPVIEASLIKVNATKYWNTLFTAYNKFSLDKVNPDLPAYVTERALSGMFQKISLEEQKIRKDPMARTSDMLKKVFGN